jgi:hypothetical protein
MAAFFMSKKKNQATIDKIFDDATAPRPKGNPGSLWKVREFAKKYTVNAIVTLVQIMEDEDVPAAARVSAADHVLNRGWGKPVQQVEVGGVGDFTDMSDEELEQFIAATNASLGEESVH